MCSARPSISEGYPQHKRNPSELRVDAVSKKPVSPAYAGLKVRIHLPPVVSLRTIGSSAADPIGNTGHSIRRCVSPRRTNCTNPVATATAARLAPRPRRKLRSGPRRHDTRPRLFTTPAHRRTSLPAMYRCRPTVSEGSFDTLHRSNIVPSTAASTSSRSPGLSTRPQSRRPAHHLPEPLPGQIPIDGARPHGGPRVPSWEAFRRRPPRARANSYDGAGIRNPSPKLPFVAREKSATRDRM